jgi:nucleoside-diphosphate-sugar epimerase
VAKVIGMARRPFDPAAHGLSGKVVYQRGDVLDRPSVDSLVDGADVVVHLAFIIIGDPDEAQRINTEGSRNVFDATVEAGAKRLVYTSSVAAYGFHADNPQPLTEDIPPRGSEDFYYSAHKAELERVLDDAIAGSGTEAYVFRPSIVAGAGALTLIETTVRLLPIYGQLRLARRALDQIPFLGPVLPDPGVEFQLVHTLDVATALRAAVEGAGPPGRYNLAGPGSMSIAGMARACGWWSVPVPGAAVAALSEVANRMPGLPPEVEWLNAFRAPTMMETRKARDRLGWTPEWDAEATMRETVSGAREAGVL